MATGAVITVLSNIPWGQVVDAAPKVAEGAGRLWEAAKNFRKPKLTAAEIPNTSASGQFTETDQLKLRLSELEGTVQELSEQMRASAEVIKDLANQNSLLVQRVEVARLRFVRFVIACSACVLMLSAATIYLWAAR